jgi:tetratricopeptide (TPR) repeat protein
MIIGLLSVSVLPIAARAQAPAAAKAPAAKDQGEFDIANAADKEKDPVKKLDLLHQWEQKYPDSDFKGMREVNIAQAQSQIAAKALTAGTSAGDMDTALKAAQDLIDNIDKYLAPDNKPANVTDAQWAQAKQTIILQAHMELAAVSASKKDDGKTEAEYRKIVALDPNSAATAYQLGILIYRQKKIDRFSEAFFWIARGIQMSGAEALDAKTKAAADKYLKQAYEGYHGDDTGLDDLRKMASSAGGPPPDFHVKSAIEIENEKAGDVAAFNTAHPDIALWRQIAEALKADGGPAYFETIKGSAIPPESGAFKMFKGKVVSQPSAKEVLLNVESATGDATLQFETALKGDLAVGSEVSFKGVVAAFAKDPYMLTLTVDKDDVEGIPASAFAGAPPPKPRAPRTGAKKK